MLRMAARAMDARLALLAEVGSAYFWPDGALLCLLLVFLSLVHVGRRGLEQTAATVDALNSCAY
jgi:hypothetical protein